MPPTPLTDRQLGRRTAQLISYQQANTRQSLTVTAEPRWGSARTVLAQAAVHDVAVGRRCAFANAGCSLPGERVRGKRLVHKQWKCCVHFRLTALAVLLVVGSVVGGAVSSDAAGR